MTAVEIEEEKKTNPDEVETWIEDMISATRTVKEVRDNIM